jgi:hypothetical protein
MLAGLAAQVGRTAAAAPLVRATPQVKEMVPVKPLEVTAVMTSVPLWELADASEREGLVGASAKVGAAVTLMEVEMVEVA